MENKTKSNIGNWVLFFFILYIIGRCTEDSENSSSNKVGDWTCMCSGDGSPTMVGQTFSQKTLYNMTFDEAKKECDRGEGLTGVSCSVYSK